MLFTGEKIMSTPTTERHARLFRNGRNQAVRIPREFELPGQEVIIRKDGDRLILEPVKKFNNIAELLASWEPIEDEEFPDVDEGLPPLDDIKL
jgi:antitoxin VapB